MAVNLEKYVHILGVNTISGLVTYLGIVWLASFIFFTIVIGYPLLTLGIVDVRALPALLIANALLSLGAAVVSITIPAAMKKENIEKNFPVFMAYLGAMTTAKPNYEEFFKSMAETEEYGEISKEMKRLYHLAKDWKLGYAKACRVVADTTPSPLFSNFLARLSQVVEYGEDIESFFRNQFGDIMRDMQTQYQQAAYKISTVAELFSALFVSVAFLLAFAVMMPIFFPMSPDLIAIGTFILVLVVDVILIAMARSSTPADEFVLPFYRGAPEHITAVMSTWVGILASVLAFLITWVLGIPPIYQILISALPLAVPAYLSTKAENIIRRREHTYISFIRTLGDLTKIREGAITPVLRRLRRHIYEGMNEAIDRLYKRLALTRQIFTGFALFSRELGSALISKFNELFVKAMYAGADPKKTGEIIGDEMHAILDSRKLRLQIASGARGVLYGTYIGVALGVFLAVKAIAQVFNLFQAVFASVGADVMNYFNFFNISVDLSPLVDYMTYIFAMEAAILAVVIKILDGGLMSNSTKHYVIMIIALTIVYIITDWVVSMLFPMAQSAASVTVPGTPAP